MTFLRYLFSFLIPDPLPGERWVFLENAANPFNCAFKEVIQVKDGFVAYKWVIDGNVMNPIYSESLRDFKAFQRRV